MSSAPLTPTRAHTSAGRRAQVTGPRRDNLNDATHSRWPIACILGFLAAALPGCGSSAATDAEAQLATIECRARDLADCDRDARCKWEHALQLDVEAKCTTPVPVGCMALTELCTLSMFVAESATGELFLFAAGCGNEEFRTLSLTPDDPLTDVLFVEEPDVYSWPECS